MSLINRGAYSAHRNLRTLNFICYATEARAVSLVGDFNGWNPASNPMQKGPDGAWSLRLEMRHGHHRYAFHVDGVVMVDPSATGITRDDHGQRVSLVAVS